MMKSIYIFLLLFLAMGELLSTPQQCNLVVLEGDTLPLYSLPLIKYLEENRIEFEPCPMGNYRGYYSVWEIRNDSLYLNEVLKCSDDNKNVINEIFMTKNIDDGIFASWYSDTLWVEIGKNVFSQSFGWGAYYDQEKEIIIDNGVLISSKIYDYREKIRIFNQRSDGFNLNDFINTRLNLEKPYLEDEELKFVLSTYKDSIRVYPDSLDVSNYYVMEAIKIVKELKPYTVVYMCGKKQVVRYSIPFRFSKN